MLPLCALVLLLSGCTLDAPVGDEKAIPTDSNGMPESRPDIPPANETTETKADSGPAAPEAQPDATVAATSPVLDSAQIALELQDVGTNYIVTRENTTRDDFQVSRMTRGFLARENQSGYRLAETHAAVYSSADDALEAYDSLILDLDRVGARLVRSLDLAPPARGQLFEYRGPNGAFLNTGIFTSGIVIGRFVGGHEDASVADLVENHTLMMYGRLQVAVGGAE